MQLLLQCTSCSFATATHCRSSPCTFDTHQHTNSTVTVAHQRTSLYHQTALCGCLANMVGRMALLGDATTQEGDIGHGDTDQINHLHTARTTASLRQSL